MANRYRAQSGKDLGSTWVGRNDIMRRREEYQAVSIDAAAKSCAFGEFLGCSLFFGNDIVRIWKMIQTERGSVAIISDAFEEITGAF